MNKETKEAEQWAKRKVEPFLRCLRLIGWGAGLVSFFQVTTILQVAWDKEPAWWHFPLLFICFLGLVALFPEHDRDAL